MIIAAAAGPRRQKGMGLIGLLFWLVVVGALVLIGLKVFPTVNEYLTVKRAVNKIAASNPASVAEARSAFESIKAVEYSIVSLSGKDLTVTKNGDDVVIGFAYDVQIELMPPVYLLMKYQGQSK
jgi:Tfp pilus assembly protein PilX